MSIIQTNQPNWFGSEGTPLKNGYIYVGLPNQDPVAFPQTVTFTDAQGNSFPAAQPMRTNDAGQIQYNGKPIIASIDTDYSLLILDSNKTQISGGYIPNVEATAGGGTGTDLTRYRKYQLTLAELKQQTVAVGESVGNTGKVAAEDGIVQNWLVVSNTGDPADDDTLMDFDNGLQGVRLLDEPRDGTVTASKLTETDAERDWVLARTAAASVGAVGTYAYLQPAASAIERAPGAEASGASLVYSNAAGALSTPQISPAGTWRCMGKAESGSFEGNTTLFLRIS